MRKKGPNLCQLLGSLVRTKLSSDGVRGLIKYGVYNYCLKLTYELFENLFLSAILININPMELIV